MHIEHSDFHDQLVRGLTHKMNNILSMFHGYLGMLMEAETLAPGTRIGLSRIQESAHAATDLIDRTRALARPSSIIWRAIDPAAFLSSLLPALAAQIPRGVELVLGESGPLPTIWADASRLRDALIEVVKNAGEASPQGGRIVLAVHAGPPFPQSLEGSPVSTPGWITFTVTDNGPGIDPEIALKVFAPFFTTHPQRGAAGLGLAVASGLLQQMNGSLRYRTAPGKTVFQLLLPACHQEPVTAPRGKTPPDRLPAV